MNIPHEAAAIRQAAEHLAEILDVPNQAANISFEVPTIDGRRVDAVIDTGGQRIVLEWKRSGSLGQVAAAIHQLRMNENDHLCGAIPLLAVPHMGKAAQERCAEAGISWLDLSGNGRVIAPGIFYQNLGNPNKFRRPGRPESAFGPKGSRISRQLLMEPGNPIIQRNLASITGLDEGHVSRIVGKLVETSLVERGSDGIRVTSPDTLLDAWREEYRFSRHQVIRGHIAAGSGDSLIPFIAETLSNFEERYAATALPAAWVWTRHAGFRLATLYLAEAPSAGLKMDLGFREEPRGANTWLVVPNDEGVFAGSELVDGICCVHPVQAYIDLKDHPERSSEAAAELRRRGLFGGGHDA